MLIFEQRIHFKYSKESYKNVRCSISIIPSEQLVKHMAIQQRSERDSYFMTSHHVTLQ